MTTRRYIKGPNGHDQEYKLCVLKVLTHNILGHPMTAEFIEDEQSVKLAEGMEFITAWVPYFGPFGSIPNRVHVTKNPKPLKLDLGALRSYVRSFDLVPSGTDIDSVLERNRKAMGFVE